MEEARLGMGSVERGHFTPDEDDRVRQMQLAYRNYRLALLEIVDRYREFEPVAERADQLRAFIVGYAAGLILFAKSLKLVQTFRDTPVVRRKLNEPEPSFGLQAGFFDTLVNACTSLENYTLVVDAGRFWRRHRAQVRRLGIDREAGFDLLCDVIRRQRSAVRLRFYRALRQRLAFLVRAFFARLRRPVQHARYGLQAFAGTALGGLHGPQPPPCFDEDALRELRPCLRIGDVLVMRTERKLTTSLFPGFWIHAALYLGGPDDLAAAGLDVHPSVRPHWDTISAGRRFGCVVQGISPHVVITPLETCLRVDHVAVLRPRLDEAERIEVVLESLAHVGKPYDFEFDFSQSHRLVCTALVYRCYDGRGPIAFSLVRRFGRFTLTCDELCEQALRHHPDHPPPFGLAALLLKSADGRAHRIGDAEALARLRAIQEGLRPSQELRPS
jgi:hypothetical protein